MCEKNNSEFKEMADDLKAKAGEFKEKAEARNEENREKWDETYNKGKNVAGKVGENLSKTIEDTLITMKGIQKNFDNRYQEYKETVAANKINIDLADTRNFYFLQAYLAGVTKEEISIEANNNSITIKAEFNNILKNIEADVEDVNLILSGVKPGTAERTISLSEEIIKEEISAKQNNGILFIKIPKKEVQKTKIDIE